MLNGLTLKAYDALNKCFYPAQIIRTDGKYRLQKIDSGKVESDLYITPGWIDIHTHINDGFGLFGTNADEIGYKTGVCMVVDAGTVGDYTINGFRRYIEPTIRTNFKLFICISPIGVIFHHEYNAMQYLNVQNTVTTINENRDIISGVKVRMGSEVIRHEGLEPLRLASEAARLTGLPLMVHIGGTPPYLADMEPFLREGDIVTHCFNGRGGDAWNQDGTPAEAMKRLIVKGVILDVGHGSGSFSFDVCAGAIRHELPKLTIGTDLHENSRKKYVFNMAATLTKMLGLSMPLESIIHGVTKLPAEILRLDDWCDMAKLKNSTLFRIADEPDEYMDCHGKVMRFDKKIVPAAVILNGELSDIQLPGKSPDLLL